MARRSDGRGERLDERCAAARAEFLTQERARLGLSQEAIAHVPGVEDYWVSSRTIQRLESTVDARQESQEVNRKVDKLLEQVAVAKALSPPSQRLLDLSYPELPAAEPRQDGPAGVAQQPNSHRAFARRRILIGVLAVGATVAATVFLSGLLFAAPENDDDVGRSSSDASPGTGDCLAIGLQRTPLPPQDARRLDEALPAWRKSAPTGACASAAVGYFADAIIQPLELAGAAAGVLLLAPTGEALYLTEALWNSYRQAVDGSQPESATAFAGYPLHIEVRAEAVTVELSLGGLLVGRNPQSQAFWIPVEALEPWRSAGGLDGAVGLPMSNPYIDPADGSYHQDYEHGIGRVREPAPARAPIVFERAVDRGQLLRALGDVRGRVLTQRNSSTSWFVDDRGSRRWIPDAAVYKCIDGDDLRLPQPLPGYEIAVLPLGAPMEC